MSLLIKSGVGALCAAALSKMLQAATLIQQNNINLQQLTYDAQRSSVEAMCNAIQQSYEEDANSTLATGIGQIIGGATNGGWMAFGSYQSTRLQTKASSWENAETNLQTLQKDPTLKSDGTKLTGIENPNPDCAKPKIFDKLGPNLEDEMNPCGMFAKKPEELDVGEEQERWMRAGSNHMPEIKDRLKEMVAYTKDQKDLCRSQANTQYQYYQNLGQMFEHFSGGSSSFFQADAKVKQGKHERDRTLFNAIVEVLRGMQDTASKGRDSAQQQYTNIIQTMNGVMDHSGYRG